jgi:hypothetical protein
MRPDSVTCDCGVNDMLEPPEAPPPVRQAFIETVNRSSRRTCPARSLPNTIAAVMSLAMLAGAIGWRAFFSKRTAPLA